MSLIRCTFLAAMLLLLLNTLAFGQEELRIGDWKSYLPAKKGLSVTQSPEAIFYGTEWALMRIDKDDRQLTHISKVEGLSDIKVQQLAYDRASQALVVAYENSNIDLIFDDRIVNMDQIKSNTQIVKDRTIFEISISPPYAYFSTGFGLTQLHIDEEEFGFTTFTDQAVESATFYEGHLYFSTSDGVYRIAFDPTTNFSDFSLWSRLDQSFGLPEIYSGHQLTVIDDKLYAGIADEVFVFDGNTFTKLHRIPNHRLLYVVPVEEGVLTGWECNETCSQDRKYLISETRREEIKYPCSTRAIDAVVDEAGQIWFADQNDDFKFAEGLRADCQSITPDRPITHNASQLATFDRKLYVAAGGVTINYGYTFRSEGLYTNENGSWSAINRFNNSALADRNMRDFLAVEINDEGTVYVGTFWDGLIEYKDGEVMVYDQENSSLQNSIINPDRNRITDMTFDRQGNLWILNHDAPKPLSVFTAQGDWQNFDLPGNDNVETIAVDFSGIAWIGIGGEGMVLYDPGQDLLSANDDQTRRLNINNSNLSSNQVNDVAVDKDGAVWVGTSSGPVLFDCGNQSFASNCNGIVLIVEENGIPGPLLGTENIKVIEIDGGNRKWFGTTNGIFVQSADAESQVMKPLRENNSPLFDNTIIDIAIDGIDGEVFIATNKGILSFRSDAVEGQVFHQPELDIFPNPVRPDYRGPIAIRGLAQNANVKITDMQGKLVFESRAIGGQALWYGDDLDGSRAASGVYLVFSTSVENLDTPDGAIGKIILVN